MPRFDHGNRHSTRARLSWLVQILLVTLRVCWSPIQHVPLALLTECPSPGHPAPGCTSLPAGIFHFSKQVRVEVRCQQRNAVPSRSGSPAAVSWSLGKAAVTPGLPGLGVPRASPRPGKGWAGVCAGGDAACETKRSLPYRADVAGEDSTCGPSHTARPSP